MIERKLMSDTVGKYCKLWDDDPDQCEYGIVERYGYMSGYHANGRVYENALVEDQKRHFLLTEE